MHSKHDSVGSGRGRVGQGSPGTRGSLEELVASCGPCELEDGIAILGDVLDQLVELHRFERSHGALAADNVFVEFGTGGAAATLGLPDHGGRARPFGYVAPERKAGDPPSRDADVWAVGALAYLLFSGSRPEAGPYADVEPLALIAPAVPLRLGGIVGRMLAPDRAHRPSAADAAVSVRQLRELLRPPVGEETAGEPERPAGWLQRLVGRKAPLAAPAAPARVQRSSRASLSLLCLGDLEPIPRAPPPELSAGEALAGAIAATLAEGLALEELPTFPSVAVEVIELARREDVGANELVRVIHLDPSLTARVLRMANSAYASRGVEVAGIRAAITRLGLREVAGIAAAAAARTVFAPDVHAANALVVDAARRCWIHAIASAMGASWLAMECGADTQRAFLGGMLHDVGKALALRGFARLLGAGRLRGQDPEALLTPILEATHAELGLWLARTWALPSSICRACGEHHAPRVGPQEDRELYLVRLASGLASLRLDPGWNGETLREVLESATLLGFDRFRIRAAATQLRGLVAHVTALADADD